MKIKGESGHAIMDLEKESIYEGRKSVYIGKHVCWVWRLVF